MSTTGCSHNFCSICLRNHLLVQQNCPSCFTDLHETQIKPNKLVQEIILLTKSVLPKLSEMLFGEKNNESSKTTPSSTSTTTSLQQSTASKFTSAPVLKFDESVSVNDSTSTSFKSCVDVVDSSHLSSQAMPGPSRLGKSIRCHKMTVYLC